jgi:hypothetical protein
MYVYVVILCQLGEHEGSDVLPRYSGSFVGISAEKDLVLTRGRLVHEPGARSPILDPCV